MELKALPFFGAREPRFEFFPKEGKNPKASAECFGSEHARDVFSVFLQAYLDAIKAFKPGDVCTVSACHVCRRWDGCWRFHALRVSLPGSAEQALVDSRFTPDDTHFDSCLQAAAVHCRLQCSPRFSKFLNAQEICKAALGGGVHVLVPGAREPGLGSGSGLSTASSEQQDEAHGEDAGAAQGACALGSQFLSEERELKSANTF